MSSPLSEPLSFDRVAAQYERTRPLPGEVADEVARYIASLVEPNEWILDAGCGTGRFTRALIKHHPQVTGADVSPEMLAELRRLQSGFPQPVLVTTDLRALPFPDAQFGAILAVHVLHLIADWKKVIAEIWRVLAPGGVFLLGYEDRSKSQVRDFYMTEGQRRGLLPRHPGVRNTHADVLPFLESEYGATDVETVSPPAWEWTRMVSIAAMLSDLDSRLYSSQWQIPETAHIEVMAATRANAEQVFGALDSTEHETQETRFVLHVVRKS
ncbi:MAG: class I SAM-dependent methyltransferase [Akkermansiaceae bacterium]|nr:class I SAM-dependent methyltransferase [Armatimonadota bacterium]